MRIILSRVVTDVKKNSPTLPERQRIISDSGGGLFGALAPGGGINGSMRLSVPVSADSAYIYQTEVAKAEEGYLTFWFNPNGVNLPEPDPNWWPPLVAFYVRRPPGQGYQGYLAWPIDNEAGTRHYDYEAAFDLSDGWQQITLGYHIDVPGWLIG